MDLTLDFLIAGVISLIVLWDIRSGKIPNILLMVLLIIKITKVEASFAGMIPDRTVVIEGIISGIGCIVLMVILLFPFFSIGALGAGDIKLTAVSALGFKDPVLFFLTVFVMALLMGVVKLLAGGKFLERLRYLKEYLTGVVVSGTVSPYLTDISERRSYSLHLSLPILAAFLIHTFIDYHGWGLR